MAWCISTVYSTSQTLHSQCLNFVMLSREYLCDLPPKSLLGIVSNELVFYMYCHNLLLGGLSPSYGITLGKNI